MRVNHLLFIQCLGVCFYWCASTIRIEAQVIQPTHSFPQIHHIHAISPLTENIEEYNESDHRAEPNICFYYHHFYNGVQMITVKQRYTVEHIQQRGTVFTSVYKAGVILRNEDGKILKTYGQIPIQQKIPNSIRVNNTIRPFLKGRITDYLLPVDSIKNKTIAHFDLIKDSLEQSRFIQKCNNAYLGLGFHKDEKIVKYSYAYIYNSKDKPIAIDTFGNELEYTGYAIYPINDGHILGLGISNDSILILDKNYKIVLHPVQGRQQYIPDYANPKNIFAISVGNKKDSVCIFDFNTSKLKPPIHLDSLTKITRSTKELDQKWGKDLVIKKIENRLRLFDQKNKDVLDPSIYVYHQDYGSKRKAVYSNKNHQKLYGFINSKGKIICPLQFRTIQKIYPTQNLIVVQHKDDSQKKALFDLKTLKFLTDYEYDYIDRKCSSGLIRVIKNRTYGFIDTTGKLTIPLKFKYPRQANYATSNIKFSGKYAVVAQNKSLIIIDKKGKKILKIDSQVDYADLKYYHSAFGSSYVLRTRLRRKKGASNYVPDKYNYQIFDTNNHTLSKNQYKTISFHYSEKNKQAFFRVSQANKVGIIDLDNKPLLMLTNSVIEVSNNKPHLLKTLSNYTHVSQNPNELLYSPLLSDPIQRLKKPSKAKVDFFDLQTHKYLFGNKYTTISTQNDSVFVVGIYDTKTRTCKYGMVDYKDQLIIPIEYDYLSFFREGLAIVGKRNQEDWEYGFINQKNELTIPYQYNKITHFFNNGIAKGQIKKGIHIQDVEISKPDQ